jgi:hypothetical protein
MLKIIQSVEDLQIYEKERDSLLKELEDFGGKISFLIILDMVLKISSLMIVKKHSYDRNYGEFVEYPIGELAILISLLNGIREFSKIPNFFLYNDERLTNPLDS